MKLKTKTEKETKKLAKKVAGKLKSKRKDGATVLTLSGDLGAGKTTFTKGFADYFEVPRITSPTFVVMKRYEINKAGFKWLYHIDCYRLDKGTSLEEINFNEIIKNGKNIVLIEWPERLKEIPKGSFELSFRVTDEKKREIEVPKSLGLKK